jgi:hypothetical protein
LLWLLPLDELDLALRLRADAVGFDRDLAFDCDEALVERFDALLVDALFVDGLFAFGAEPLDELLLRGLREAGLLFAIVIPLFKVGQLLEGFGYPL